MNYATLVSNDPLLVQHVQQQTGIRLYWNKAGYFTTYWLNSPVEVKQLQEEIDKAEKSFSN